MKQPTTIYQKKNELLSLCCQNMFYNVKAFILFLLKRQSKEEKINILLAEHCTRKLTTIDYCLEMIKNY